MSTHSLILQLFYINVFLAVCFSSIGDTSHTCYPWGASLRSFSESLLSQLVTAFLLFLEISCSTHRLQDVFIRKFVEICKVWKWCHWSGFIKRPSMLLLILHNSSIWFIMFPVAVKDFYSYLYLLENRLTCSILIMFLCLSADGTVGETSGLRLRGRPGPRDPVHEGNPPGHRA